MKLYVERRTPRTKIEQSEHGTDIRERNQKSHLLEACTLSNNSIESKVNKPSLNSKLDNVNCIDKSFLFKKRGHSLETNRQWIEQKQILNSGRIRIVAKGKDNEQIQEARLSQQGRKQIVELSIQIYNPFFQYCETFRTTPLREFQQNSNESWLNNNISDG